MTHAPRLRSPAGLWPLWERYGAVLVLLGSMAFTAACALVAGPDLNYDLRNYHFWSAHAMLHGTTFAHVGPGQVQSWTNPLVYLPAYFVIGNLGTFAGSLVMGAWAGINGLLLYLLTMKILRGGSPRRRLTLALAVTACGISGAVFLGQVGTSMADPLCSMLILSGLLALYYETPYRFFLSALLVGAAVGLKLTCASYAIGLALALLAGWRSWGLTPTRYAGFALGGLLGAALTAGYWSVLLYQETGNPLFPYYNALFRSPFFEPMNYVDYRHLPQSILHGLSYPFQWLIGRYPSAESPFRDARFAFVFVAVPLTLGAALLGRSRPPAERAVADRDFRFILAFFAVSFAVWMMVWSINRYQTVLELLTGLVLLLCADRFALPARLRDWGFLAAIAVCILWTQPGYWKRQYNPTGSYFSLAIEDPRLRQPHTLYAVVGGSPMSYAIPFFPDDARFVRLTANYGRLGPKTPLGKLAGAAIDRHDGPLRTLTVAWLKERDGAPIPISTADRATLGQFGLGLGDPKDCVEFRSTHDVFQSCPLVKAPPVPVPPG
jgi:hypothetical protein